MMRHASVLDIPVPGIAIVTVTDGLHGLVIQVAGLGVAVATGPGAWTQTLPARNLVLSELRRPIEANLETFMCGQEIIKSRTRSTILNQLSTSSDHIE